MLLTFRVKTLCHERVKYNQNWKQSLNINLLTEKGLIKNRIDKKFQDGNRICAKHRYKMGIYCRAPLKCKHPDHSKQSKIIKYVLSNWPCDSQIHIKYIEHHSNNMKKEILWTCHQLNMFFFTFTSLCFTNYRS